MPAFKDLLIHLRLSSIKKKLEVALILNLDHMKRKWEEKRESVIWWYSTYHITFGGKCLIQIRFVLLCFYGVLRYLISIAILRPITLMDPNLTTQQTANSLVVRPLFRSFNCAWSCVAPVFGQGTLALNVVHLTQQQQVHLLTSFSWVELPTHYLSDAR